MTMMTITFLDKKRIKHRITYKLFKSNLTEKWVDIICENQRDHAKKIYTAFMNRTKEDIPELHKDIIDHVKKINLRYVKPLPLYEGKTELTLDDLNELHHLFEEYGDLYAETETNQILHNLFLQLNEKIHAYEHALEDKTIRFPEMSAVVDYYPQELFVDLQERDKLFLVSNHRWGELYLGYNTLGKDWLTASSDNDIDLVLRKSVRPQRRFAAEFWLNFTKDCDAGTKMELFEQWYDSLPPDAQESVPIDNLNELTLGKFILGEVYINEYFLKFDPNKNNWKASASDTQAKWNREVFSTFREIVSIDIFDRL